MNNELNITLSELSDCASQIRNYNATLDDILSSVSKAMHEINSIWQSDGEEVLLNRFDRFATRFIDESEVIESYAKFLDSTVSDYDSLESTIVANASSFD